MEIHPPVDSQNEKSFDIAIIGHFSKDRIVARGRETVRSGGAVFYGSIAVARLGIKVAAITKVAEGDLPFLEPMTEAGVSVFPIIAEATTSIENRYLDDTLERRECVPLGFAGAYRIDDLPDIGAKIWHVGGLVRGEVDLEMLKHLSKLGRLSADAQGFVRLIRCDKMLNEDWPEKREALPLLDFFKTDAAEAEILTGSADVHEAAKTLAGWGAGEVVLTHPGGLLVMADGKESNTPFAPRVVKGRTGRGDTCISSYLARRIVHPSAESGRFAAALCSIKMESEGPFSGTVEDVFERISEQ